MKMLIGCRIRCVIVATVNSQYDHHKSEAM